MVFIPSLSTRRLCGVVRLAVLFGVAVLLGGCFDSQVAIVFDRSGAGTVEFAYQIPTSTLHAGEFDVGSLPPLFPVTEADFVRFERVVSGVTLTRYRRVNHRATAAVPAYTAITATFRFDSVAQVSSLLHGRPDAIVVGPADDGAAVTGSTAFVQQFPFDPTELSDDAGHALSAMAAGNSFSVSVTAPQTITLISHGTLDGDRRTASIAYTLAEWLAGDGPTEWRLRW